MNGDDKETIGTERKKKTTTHSFNLRASAKFRELAEHKGPLAIIGLNFSITDAQGPNNASELEGVLHLVS